MINQIRNKFMTTYPERSDFQKFMIVNFLDIIDLIGNDNERMLSMLRDIRLELDAERITSNVVIASDRLDTQWLFDIVKIENDIYILEYTGTAK